ncbi:TrmB family transcriptional regulator [Hymenobacter crusticola]|uniref:Transcription regulator TrmB N-terminal domain-containing protein n=1 Tax=Hymenobacter crusticola TaxID=1770526 RepID=A0A243W531_9BACT|nr:helix-turn-helix domain-containing protein [Hymenobacter crusticola]OUJ65570.1 hypothetical protein BXP70_29155 [Hymenobacter crusticola]
MRKDKELLIELGLNDLEAEVYGFLLQHPEAWTGYKIGKKLGKPTANVYKALDSLAKKGAILMEDQASRQGKAVPIDEFCALVEASIRRKSAAARHVFTQPKSATYDERSYQLHSVELVLEKARQMLASCQAVVMLDVFPQVATLLTAEVAAVVARGIQVYLQVYEPLTMPGAEVVLIDLQPQVNVLSYWRSQQLNLIVDGKEHLLALLSDRLGEVYQASWSKNLYLSSMLHMGFSNHYTVARLRQLPGGAEYAQQVQAILQQQSILSSGAVPGVSEMLTRYGLQ